MSAKHTPGPLHVAACNGHKVSDGHICVAIRDARGDVVPETVANLTLWAAAPELLEALEEVLYYRGGADNALADENVVERIRAALAKAGAR